MSRRTNFHFQDRDDVNDDDDDDDIRQLSSKVKTLKNVSIQIGEETREHIRYLKHLDNKADSTWSSLSLNMEHVKKLARGGHNKIAFYLIGFIAFVMLVIYLMNKSLS